MKAVKFDQANVMLAEDQPEYETLPVYVEYHKAYNADNDKFAMIPWKMTACLELTDEEIEEIVRNRRIWHSQLVMGRNFQPIFMTTKSPFSNEETLSGSDTENGNS